MTTTAMKRAKVKKGKGAGELKGEREDRRAAPASKSKRRGVGEPVVEREASLAAPHASAIEQLRALQAYRVIVLRQQLRIRLSAMAMIRVAAGWRWDDNEESRGKQNTRAMKILDGVWQGKELPLEDQAVAASLGAILMQFKQASEPFEQTRNEIEKAARKLAKTLPVYQWVKDANGVSADTLAVIVGECGDLSNYPSWKHAAKRMGLAPYKGKMGSTWKSSKPSLSAEEWVDYGYVGRRRAIMHTWGDAQIRNRTKYREVYEAFKAKELERTDDNKPKSQGHAHKRAMLFMERIFMLELWKAWRATTAGRGGPADGSEGTIARPAV